MTEPRIESMRTAEGDWAVFVNGELHMRGLTEAEASHEVQTLPLPKAEAETQQVYVVVRQADVGEVSVDGVYADWNDAMKRRDYLEAQDGAAYVSWIEEETVTPPSPIITKTGREMTEAELQQLADEAERGYDVTELRERASRREGGGA